MPIKADLHVHTTYSDGHFTPLEILQKAKQRNLKILSITDHDTLQGYLEAVKIAPEYDIQLIPGIELSSIHNNKEVHILAYYLDVNNQNLNDYLEKFRLGRIDRAHETVEKLQNMGLEITIDDVMAEVPNSLVGRPHMAAAIIKKGYAENFGEVFARFLGDRAPAFTQRELLSCKDAIDMIVAAEGIPIIAHPGSFDEDTLKFLVKAGAWGFESTHPSHSSRQAKLLRIFARQRFLLFTGGSDYHGGRRMDEPNFGTYHVTNDVVFEMRRKYFKKFGKAV